MVETSDITFQSEDIGNWEFQVYGEGKAPKDYDLQSISSSLNKDMSGHVRFRNPFKQEITVTVKLVGEDDDLEAFDLLLQKKKGIKIKAFAALEVPFGFRPK